MIVEDGLEEFEPDEYEEAMANCHGYYERGGVFVCGAAGSEDCDFECPFSRDLGLTVEEAEQRDIEEMHAEAKARREAIDKACDPWFDVQSATADRRTEKP